jgi:hypothetical protein
MSKGVNGYTGTRPYRITRVAKSQTGTRESSSKAVQLELAAAEINSCISDQSHLILYRRVQQTAAVEQHAD